MPLRSRALAIVQVLAHGMTSPLGIGVPLVAALVAGAVARRGAWPLVLTAAPALRDAGWLVAIDLAAAGVLCSAALAGGETLDQLARGCPRSASWWRFRRRRARSAPLSPACSSLSADARPALRQLPRRFRVSALRPPRGGPWSSWSLGRS